MCTAFAHVTVARNNRNFARNHHVSGAFDAVYQAFAAAIQIVKFRLGHRVVHVNRREWQFATLLHLVQTVYACGGFFGHALNVLQAFRIPVCVLRQMRFNRSEQHGFFFVAWFVQHRNVFFGFAAQNQQQSRVAAIVQNHVGFRASWPIEDFVSVFPIVFQAFAFVSEHGNACFGNRCGSVVLGRENIARSPAQFRAQSHQGFHQHSGLYRHVQRARNARAFQGFFFAVFFAQGHQAWHFGFSDVEFFASPSGEADISNFVI